MNKKRLPIGIQTFAKIRAPKENYVYVDKTEMAHRLIEAGSNYFFLSRPRRFGKSLFVDTLDSLFSGSKEFFEDLYIYDKWDWSETYPVIRIDFTNGRFSSEEDVNFTIKESIKLNCTRHNIPYDEIATDYVGTLFSRLIIAIHEKYNQKVVILVDEYDKPILDNITKQKKETALTAREILRSFYSTIKGSDRYLKFVFITGVSKFSRLNLFSGLNNIEDITINENYSTLTGYTQNDLETHFTEYLQGLDIEAIKRWYNGYNYFGEPIYNPFDVLLFFSNNGTYSNYWWETGNSSFFIEKLKEENYYLPYLENIEVTRETLNAFDIEYIDIVALLWQTGYLTFAEKLGDEFDIVYKMKVPNLEIQKSLNSLFFDYLANYGLGKTSLLLSVKKALLNKDIEAFKGGLTTLFSSIPYDNYVKNTVSIYEGYYASVMFTFISSMGFIVKAEEHTHKGRIDMSIIGNNLVYILEFKVDMPSESALHQIETRKYYEKYQNQGNEIFLIGIHFNSEMRNIENMEWKKL